MKMNTKIKILMTSILCMLLPYMASANSVQDIVNNIEQFQFDNKCMNETISKYMQIQKTYINLDRKKSNQSKLVMLKYKMEVFNYWFSQNIIENIDQLASDDNLNLQNLFDSFPFILKEKQAKRLGLTISKDAPKKFLDVKTLEGTQWSQFISWKDLDLATNYSSNTAQATNSEESVYYHGVEFQTGDVIISDTNTYGYEIAASTRDTVQTGNHSAIFVLMKDGDKSIPTVFDMHADGIRATPLSHYLHEKINSYVEIYRLNEHEKMMLSNNWKSRIRKYFESNLAKQQSYRFDFTASAENNDQRKLTCAELVLLALEAGGMTAPFTKLTNTTDAALKMIKSFGTFSGKYLAPADFVYDGRFKMVGYFDMLNVKKNLLIKLNSVILAEVIQNQTINTQTVLEKIKTHVKLISAMTNPKSFMGKLLIALSGVNTTSFPEGEPTLIALNLFFEEEVTKSISACLGEVSHLVTDNNSTENEATLDFLPCYYHFAPILENLTPKFNVKDFLFNSENSRYMKMAMKDHLEYFNNTLGTANEYK